MTTRNTKAALLTDLVAFVKQVQAAADCGRGVVHMEPDDRKWMKKLMERAEALS